MWANLADKNKNDVKTGGAFGGRNTYGPLLVMLKADKQAVLVREKEEEGENQTTGKVVCYGHLWHFICHASFPCKTNTRATTSTRVAFGHCGVHSACDTFCEGVLFFCAISRPLPPCSSHAFGLHGVSTAVCFAQS